MTSRLLPLLALLLVVSPAVATADPDALPTHQRYSFKPTQPFGATGVDAVVLWGAVEPGWDLEAQALLRDAFLGHLFVTGPDSAPVQYGVAVEASEGPLPFWAPGPVERLILTGLPEGWNSLWIFKRELYSYQGTVIPRLVEGFAPEAGGPEGPGFWIETDQYWRLDYLVGRSAPGIAAITTAGETTSSVSVVWSEPVTATASEMAASLDLLGPDDAPLYCRATEAEPLAQTVFTLWCNAEGVDGLRLVSAPEGADSGVAAEFPPLDAVVPLADWPVYEDVFFPIRREAVAPPEVTLPDPVLPEFPEPPQESLVGCSGAPGAPGLLLAVFAALAARRRGAEKRSRAAR